MSKLQWSDDLAVGVELIDREHKELFSRIDALLQAMAKGQGKAEVVKVIDFLERYVVIHFSDEESLMLSVKYPGYAAHKLLHTAFIRDVAALKADLAAHGANAALAIRAQQELSGWLVNHIRQVDTKLAAFVKAAAPAGQTRASHS